MIAGVILNRNSEKTDKLYDYLVPDGMEVRPGTAVMVPFGTGNKPYEAYVIRLREGEGSKKVKYKYISELSPKGQVFGEDLIEVIMWMRDKYLCTYAEAAQACIPAGIAVKSAEYYRAAPDARHKSRIKDSILEAIQAAGGEISKQELLKLFENDIGDHLRGLAAEGLVTKSFRSSQTVNDKTVLAARINTDKAVALEAAEKMRSRSPAGARILELLADGAVVSVKDLKELTCSSGSSVKTLEKKGLIVTSHEEILRDPANLYVRSDKIKTLTSEQDKALESIAGAVKADVFREFLLYGVTGSGKTEVYLQAIDRVLSEGKQAVVLVPEIALTPQTVNRFTARFPDRVAVFHSGLSQGEKYDQWKKMRAGRADIVIGARSAVFAPFSNIGIIIVDEEHSESYKSEMPPRYDAREVARYRAKQHNAALVLASATPSVGDFEAAVSGVTELLKMEHRANAAVMPEVYIADMRAELAQGNKSIFSRRLYEEIKLNKERGEQTILFMNRRGFSTFVSCRECGFVAECPNCSISMTYHKAGDVLRCHYCGYETPNYTECPSCGSRYIRYFGGGTQRVEEEIKKLFPDISTLRMDIDTTGKKQSHQEILHEFEEKKIDILIGTQMVAKGLDFENVTLVGVVSADTMLHIDDFRSAERTFSLLEQVAGRAGRGNKAGRAVIQTYSPEHKAVVLAAAHDYLSFYDEEIKLREMMWYPPYSDMISIRFTGISQTIVSRCARFFVKQMEFIGYPKGKIQLLGPIPAGVAKVNNKYRWQLLIKCTNADSFNDLLTTARRKCMSNDNYKNVTITIDKNPVQII